MIHFSNVVRVKSKITARNEGQVSLLAKKNGHKSASICANDGNINDELDSVNMSVKKIISENHNEESKKRVSDFRDYPPPGTVYPRSQSRVTSDITTGGEIDGSVGSIMCCSDKIAKWNALGKCCSHCYFYHYYQICLLTPLFLQFLFTKSLTLSIFE